MTLEDDKLEAMAALAYGASHEINNPLANIATRAQALLAEETSPEKRQNLAMIHSQAMRAHEMISNLMLFAKPPQLQVESFELLPWLAELCAEWQGRFELFQVQRVEEFAELAAMDTATADRLQLSIAIGSLIQNALEALPPGGKIWLRAAVQSDIGQSRSLQIAVADNGPGITADIRPHIFDPFFSGREAGRGLGLGLSKAWRIAQLHGGKLRYQEGTAGGAVFLFTIPLDGSL